MWSTETLAECTALCANTSSRRKSVDTVGLPGTATAVYGPFTPPAHVGYVPVIRGQFGTVGCDEPGAPAYAIQHASLTVCDREHRRAGSRTLTISTTAYYRLSGGLLSGYAEFRYIESRIGGSAP